MRKRFKVLFVVLFISSLTGQVVDAEEQYNHIWTAESPNIESNIVVSKPSVVARSPDSSKNMSYVPWSFFLTARSIIAIIKSLCD